MRPYKEFVSILMFLLCFCVLPAQASERPPENGVMKQYYAGGGLRFEGRYKNGQPVRIRKFYENGRLEMEYRYKDKKLSLTKTFYVDGQLKSVWSRKTGIAKNYYPDGRLKSETATSPEDSSQHKSSYLFSIP